MKKYICTNCGFRHKFQTQRIQPNKRLCKRCETQVYSSNVVLESLLRLDILKH